MARGWRPPVGSATNTSWRPSGDQCGSAAAIGGTVSCSWPLPSRRLTIRAGQIRHGSLDRVEPAAHFIEKALTRFGVSVFAYSKTFDVAKCRRDLGPPPVDLATGVARLVAAWREAAGA